jgi:renalase
MQAGITATIIDRGRAPGGRMASPRILGRRVDIGASYFTVSDPVFSEVVRRWSAADLAREWTQGFDTYEAGQVRRADPKPDAPMRWAAPDGLRALVSDLLTPHAVQSQRSVKRVASDGKHLTVDGEPFDVVVLAMPDPQAARLLSPELASAADVAYEPVIAVTAAWTDREWSFKDGAFVNGHDVLSFVADDGARRGDAAAVLVAHTTAGFAAQYLQAPESAVAPVLAAMRELFDIGEPSPGATAHRWTFAKPTGTHRGSPYLITESGIGLAGDSWCQHGSPRVESAWLSGTALGTAIAAGRK